ncbi:hypothetical protein GCM10007385_02320 [Tateyamaria omphalii]|uniref:glycosyl transferase family 3 n=1 Tax=Tateyamaria omphalii TaxID=299262 RepID=UPI001671FE2D|nr:glycosyl transferase family 3 [Tateyamaria omphalii]GGX38944.1 hypothetical protein GCM10007385_02320 [Tateyamaria omphalii]
MSLAPFIQIVARGKGRARTMSFEEAEAAMAIILSGNAAPEAIGALLMVMRLRGETAEEIAGFTSALRAREKGTMPRADLDWPVYAGGRSRGAPLFLVAARLVAQAGYTVAMHGWNSHHSDHCSIRTVLKWAGPGVHYCPLETLCPEAFSLLKLRSVLGLRSCFNTVLRMWNPSAAPVTVQGVFHPSYRSLQAQAARILGQQDLTVIKGGGGEFERHPGKDIAVFGLRNGQHVAETAPAVLNDKRRLHDVNAELDLGALWRGQCVDPFAVATITGTAAIALWSLHDTQTLPEAETKARMLWQTRHSTESLSA